MSNRRYLEDWEKPELTAEELFLAEGFFVCKPNPEFSESLIDTVLESDEIIEDVVDAEEPPPIPEWSGFVIFTDVHSCTPVGDAQQSDNIRLVDFEFCDDPECGGPGGWRITWTNAP